MGSFSSKPTKTAKAPPGGSISGIDRAVLDLKNSRDRLQRYRKKLDADEVKLVEQAKKAKAAGKTDRALGIMRLRKYKQQQASACEEQLLNVLTMVETIDSRQNDKSLLEALESGKTTLKQMHEETTVEHVLDLMDAIQEEHAVEQEITEILQGVPTLSVSDEEAVERELAAMQAEMTTTEAIKTEEDVNLPVAPSTKLPQQPTAEPVSKQPEQRVAVPG